MSLFTWGSWATADRLCGQCDLRWGLSATCYLALRRGRELVNHTSDQFCVCDWAQRKSLNTKAQVSVPGWQHSKRLVTTHTVARTERCPHDSTKRGQLTAWTWTLLRTPLSGLIWMCPFMVRNCKRGFCEYCESFKRITELERGTGDPQLAVGRKWDLPNCVRSHRHILRPTHGHEGTDTCASSTSEQLPDLRLALGSLTILLFTSSSIALTSSAALGVSELVGRTNNREEAYGRSEEKERGGGEGLVLVTGQTANSPASSSSF